MHLIINCFLFYFIATCGADNDSALDILIKMKNDMDQCSKDTGATKDDAKFMWSGTASTSSVGDCLLACVMKKIGSMNPDNKINIEREKEIAKKLPNYSDKISQLLDQCKSEEKPEGNECQAAKNYWTCIIKYKEQYGIARTV